MSVEISYNDYYFFGCYLQWTLPTPTVLSDKAMFVIYSRCYSFWETQIERQVD